MPQPLPNGRTVVTGANYILRRPELAAQAAAVCANFSLIEGQLVSIYALVLGMTLPFDPPAAGAPMVHRAGIQILDAINSLNGRLDLVRRLLESYVPKNEFEHFRDNLCPAIRKRFEERSIVAHGDWGICDDYPDALILSRPFQPQQIWKKRDFESTSQRIIKCWKDLNQFSEPILERASQER